MIENECFCEQCHSPVYLIELVSADGLRTDHPIVVADVASTREYKRMILDRPSASPRERVYRSEGRTRRERGKKIHILNEVVPDPPKPERKVVVCNTEVHKWCYACLTTHRSIAPRLVHEKEKPYKH